MNRFVQTAGGVLCFTLAAHVPGLGAQGPTSSALDTLAVPASARVVTRGPGGRTTIRTTHLSSPLTLDGVLDEDIYFTVSPVSDLIQQEPQLGEPATEKTDLWFSSDGDRLYVSARCWDTDLEGGVFGDMRRDGESHRLSESLMVGLDTYHDQRSGYLFGVNSMGGVADSQVTNEKSVNRDWNGIWDARVGRFDRGWTVEIMIPFKSVRYTPGAQSWGIQVRRVVARKNEVTFLTEVPPAVAGIYRFSSAASLVDLGLPRTAPDLEVKAYGLTGIRTDRQTTPLTGNELDRNAGFDIKYGLTRSLTADFTYRTDFAQAEDDDQQINLTRFSLFFPEKREFFLEGRGMFAERRAGGDTPIIFFSRRIGLEDGQRVPIQFGGRLTGKVGSYSIGFVNIQTGDEPSSGTGESNFTVIRLKRDVLSRSNVGFLFTRRSRSIVGAGSNEAYAVDGLFSFFQNLNLTGYLARTRTPDLSNDDTSYLAQLDYNADRYGVKLEQLKVGEDFNPEVGFVRRRGIVRRLASLRFSPRPRSTARIRKFYWEATYDQFAKGSGQLESRSIGGAHRIELQNGDRVSFEVERSEEHVENEFNIASDVTILRDVYTFHEIRTGYNFGPLWSLSGNVRFDAGGFYGGTRKALSYLAGRMRLTPMFTLYPSVSVNWIDLPQKQFMTRLVSLRALYTLTPRMFLLTFWQYSSDVHDVSVNMRLRWEYQPSSELFLVYNEGRSTLPRGHFDLANRSFIVKVTKRLLF